jgi:hypothetical protein
MARLSLQARTAFKRMLVDTAVPGAVHGFSLAGFPTCSDRLLPGANDRDRMVDRWSGLLVPKADPENEVHDASDGTNR